jgi:hypothetical protein
MATLVVVLLGLAAIAYIASALGPGSPRDGSEAGPAGPRAARASEAEARKRVALGAIVDLHEERTLGKLSDADFDALVATYEQEALAALRELDSLHAPTADADLEREIAAVRRSLECSGCGAPRRPGSPCPRCGA